MSSLQENLHFIQNPDSFCLLRTVEITYHHKYSIYSTYILFLNNTISSQIWVRLRVRVRVRARVRFRVSVRVQESSLEQQSLTLEEADGQLPGAGITQPFLLHFLVSDTFTLRMIPYINSVF